MLKYCDMVGGSVGSLEKCDMMREVWLDGRSLVLRGKSVVLWENCCLLAYIEL